MLYTQSELNLPLRTKGKGAEQSRTLSTGKPRSSYQSIPLTCNAQKQPYSATVAGGMRREAAGRELPFGVKDLRVRRW